MPRHSVAQYTNVDAQTTVKANVEVGDLKAPTKALDMNAQKVEDIAAPTVANDAVRKAYADLLTLLTTFNDHKARHQNAGADEVSVAALSGLLADDQHVLDAEVRAVSSELTVAETEVYSGVAVNTWTDLNLSGTIGSQATLVLVKIQGGGASRQAAFRRNGDTDESYHTASYNASAGQIGTSVYAHFIVVTDTSGIIEWRTSATGGGMTIDVVAYIK